MAASQVSAMKMTNLLFGVILGLLAVVHSTPVNTVTQIPDQAEDEVIREAVTDGFLVEHFFFPSLTTESPKSNTTVPASQQPSSDSAESDMIEGSAGETSDESTTFGFLHFTSTTQSTSTVLPRDTDDSGSDSSTTQSTQFSSTTSSAPHDAQTSATQNHISASQSTDPAVSSFDFLSTQSSDLESGDGENFITTSSMSSNSDTSTASSLSTAAFIRLFGSEGPDEGSGSGSGSGTEIYKPVLTEIMSVSDVNKGITAAPQKNVQGTPGWMIIVGFIVGVAALVMLFVAIATRDKWNGPSQATQLEPKTNSTNQERELEMETFLHKDSPRENGKAAEYTVIPLDELPGKYSSH